MISGVPLFRGRDNPDQLLHIMRIIGTPDERTLRKMVAESVRLSPEPVSSSSIDLTRTFEA
jgi:negative regulator of PHO system